MNSTHVSNPASRTMLTAGALVALLVFGMIVAQPQAGSHAPSGAEGAVPTGILMAQAEPVASLTESVNWTRVPASADASATAVAAY